MKNHFARLNRVNSAPSIPLLSAITLLLFLAAPAHAAERQTLSGHIPAIVQRLQSIGQLSDTNMARLAIGLPLRDKAGLTNFLRQLYDPASPGYRKYLTPAEFTERFGPSRADYDALLAFAVSNHLSIPGDGQHPNRMMLDVQVSVSDIRRVFHVNLREYNHPTENRRFYAPDAEPSVDTQVPLLYISGLSDYVLPHPASLIKKPMTAGVDPAPNLGSGPGGTYLGGDFRAAYAPGVTLNGSGQSVGLLEFDNYFVADVNAYESIAGLPQVPLTNVLVDGGFGPPGPNDPEVSLDIEMAVAMAPGLNQILVYEAPIGGPISQDDDLINRMATDNLARQLSASWTFPIDPIVDQIFQEMGAQGQSYFNACGDGGAYSGGVPQPADNPYITVVGGTTLSTTGPGGAWQSETVWSWFNQGIGDAAGSGGISTTYPIPPWQQGIDMSTNGGSIQFRNVPDVALTADNIWVVYGDGLAGSFGGTSCATPLWAAFTALVNQQATLHGQPPVGFINPAIYSIARGPLYSSTFHDITTGNNTNFTSINEFFAVPGFDLCTGWGTPTGSALIAALVPNTAPAPVLAVLSSTVSGGNGNGLIDPDECNNFTIVVTNEGVAAATDVQGILVSTTPHVIIGQATASYPNIQPGASAQNQTPFTVSTTPGFVCGTTVNLQLILKCDQTVQTNRIHIPTGIIGSPVGFTNATSLSIPAGSFAGISSPVTVSGINTIGTVAVSVYLTAIEDEWMVFQLVSPNGIVVPLAANDGALGSGYGISCTPAASETTFADNSPQSIASGAAPFVGSFSPITPLSVLHLLNGTNVNGTWNLNVIDQLTGNTATLQCWTLYISPEDCPDGGGECPGSDLSIAMTAAPNPVITGSNFTYTLSVSNAGPSPATDVVVNQTLPPSLVFEGFSGTQGSVSESGDTLTYSLGTLGVQTGAVLSVQVMAVTPGVATSAATIGSPSSDPNPNNNTASVSVLVVKPFADLGVTVAAFPSSVPLGGQVTFTIAITNNGPATALGVTLTNLLPANVNFISSSASQGTVGGTLAFIGAIPPNSGATVTLVLSPTTVGVSTLTSTVGLDPSESDPITANNSASGSVMVVPAADLAVSAFSAPSPAASGAIFNYIVTVTNAGPDAATAVVMSQSLPPAVTFISASQPDATEASGVVTWNIGPLPSGTSLTLTNIVRAPTLPQGVLSNLLSSSLLVLGQPGDPNTNNNVAVINSLVLQPVAIVAAAGATLTSESIQPPNGAVDPGETVGVQFFLQNIGTTPTTNLVATLQATGGVVLPGGPQTYGALPPGGASVPGQFTFTANSTNGGTVIATLQLQDGPTNLGNVTFSFAMPVVSTFWKNEIISIPALSLVPFPSTGPAGPYPSTNVVSGLSNYLENVTVTISNLNHTYANNIGMLLVGPNGQSSVLMSSAALHTFPAIGETLIFDQNAPTVIPAQGQLVSGTYQPAEYNPADFYPSNASPPPPLGPYTADLSVFSGAPANANGSWYLYVYDDLQGDYGAISNGWALTFTTITPVNQIADIGAALAFSTNQVLIDNPVTSTLTITNAGPNAANVFVTNILSSGLSFLSASLPQGSYTQNGQTVVYNLGNIAAQSNVLITTQLNAVAGGAQTSAVSVGSSLDDPHLANNSAVAPLTVLLPSADVAASISAGPAPVVAGSNLVFTLTVTNNGPNTAFNVTGSFPLPATLSFVSASQSQGVIAATNPVFQCHFGNIAPGNIATVLLTASPQVPGLLTNSWTVASDSTDPNPANNAAGVVVTVTAPEPMIVAAGVRLLSESFSPPNGAIDSNETVTVAFTLANAGDVATTNLIATLAATGGITPLTASQTYGVLNPGTSAAQNFQLIGRGTPGATLTATLSLADQAYSLGTVSFAFIIPATTHFTNGAAIVIPDSGPATPYPSGISISSVTGLVTKVTATLQGFTHSFPHDVNVLLTSPSGQQSVLLGHVGGPFSVTNLVLTFDDAAAQFLPAGQMTSGTFLPTQGLPFDSFPGIVGTPTITNLSIFQGTDPNGLWSLYVYDDTAGNNGSIVNGWTLALSVSDTINPASRLAVGMVHTPTLLFSGNFLNYQIGVTNLGPSAATNVVLLDTLPSAVRLISAAASQGTVNTNVPGSVTFNLGVINAGATALAGLQLVPLQSGVILNIAAATSDSINLYPAGATASNTTTIVNVSPSFLEAAYLPNGLQLTLLGQPDQTYVVQASTNLTLWTPLSTNTADGSGRFSFIDSRTNGFRFYRGVRPPQ